MLGRVERETGFPMKWPWASRRVAEDSQVLLAKLAHESAVGYERWHQLHVAAQNENNLLRDQLAAGEAERKLLLDRIVQMSGQPPLYHKSEPVAKEAAAEPAEYTGPVAEGKLTEDRLRSLFRQQTGSGLGIVRGA